jgi:hypothetical protein
MKRFLCVAVAGVALSALGANLLITQDEALVSGALSTLKFESVRPQPGLVGAPPKFKVSKATLDHLEKLHKEGKIIEVEGNGALKVIQPKK